MRLFRYDFCLSIVSESTCFSIRIYCLSVEFSKNNHLLRNLFSSQPHLEYSLQRRKSTLFVKYFRYFTIGPNCLIYGISKFCFALFSRTACLEYTLYKAPSTPVCDFSDIFHILIFGPVFTGYTLFSHLL